MSARWWEHPFRSFQTNLREIDAGFDVEALLDDIEAYGADTWLLSVGGIIANYPSDLSCQTVNPALGQRPSGDLIGDAIEAARRRGIRVLARMDFSKVDARRAEEHPEWCFISPAGEAQIYHGYRSVCPSAGYYQHKTFDVVEEVMRRYDIAGFFFNWMSFNEYDYSRIYWGVCHCQACVQGFAEYAPGVTLPVGPGSDGYAMWKKFSAGVIDALHHRMQEHIRSIRPNVPLIMGDKADITFHEANNAVGRPLWHHRTAENVSAARSGDTERPVFVNAVGFVDMPYRWAGEDPHHFAQYLVQAIAHGAQPSTYIMGTTSDSSYKALVAGGDITRFHRDHTSVYDGLRSAARTALVRGSQAGPSLDAERRAEFEGHYLMLVENQIPFDVVRQDRLADTPPDRYDVVILPHSGQLDEAEAFSLRKFAEAGGHVVTTGDSAWDGSSFQLSTGVGQRRASYTTEEGLRALHLPVGASGDFAPVLGGFEVIDPAPGVASDWHALGRSLYGPPEKCYGHPVTSHPGWISVQVGSGSVSCAPWRPGHVVRDLGLGRVSQAWAEKLSAVAGPRVQAESNVPGQVEVVLGTNSAGALVIHLLNRSGDAVQRFRPPVRLQNLSLRLPGPVNGPVRAYAHVADQHIDVSFKSGQLHLDVPEVNLFEVITVGMLNN